ncbi:NADH dehydrogenase [ubiquinone] 1 beta subcomplex subunit 5, mitochondrial-like [Hyaena hyaena]|uniref:NADH dehydrogenase [ubiquinone] 1 beta subcomplex subunit 5, mitochondrial-like n=1 Tax=Hyaena hyaena TaxID=95912 RepID=UPI001920D9B2|nr:NADH dehydrogenase [ubiquinone] 1 beta subcomplex subunit 5, mitochondrial-like [Hyaena hyaena]
MVAVSLLQRASVTAVAALSRLLSLSRLPAWCSSIGAGFFSCGFRKTVVTVRHSRDRGKRLFIIKPSGSYDRHFLSLMKFYILLTGILVAIGITLVNIFIGEAKLAEIPEGYITEYWEYFKHTISRWISRTLFDDFEKNYEKEKPMAIPQIEAEKADLWLQEIETQRLMLERGDGPWYQYLTIDKVLINLSPKATPDN